MDLFIQPEQLDFVKVALEVALPEDPNAWPQEILQELYKQVPYISDFEPHIVMDRVEAEQGYGFGHVEVVNKSEVQSNESPQALAAAGIRQVRIPVIVKASKLQAFDVMVTDDARVLPLTEMRLRAAIFRPQAFDITSQTPGDQSMIGQLYPPYRQNYGFGGGGFAVGAGMGKEGSELEAYLTEGTKTASALDEYYTTSLKHGRLGKQSVEAEAATGVWEAFMRKCASSSESLLTAVLPTLHAEDHDAFKSFCGGLTVGAWQKNAAALLPSFKLLLEATPAQLKTASIFGLLAPTVTQVARAGGGHYTVKTASHVAWAPETSSIDRGELVRRYGVKLALEVDMAGSSTLAEGEPEIPDETPVAGPEPIVESGVYNVQSVDGKTLVGAVLCNLVDVDGRQLPLALFTDGKQSCVQGDIVGVRESSAGTDILPVAEVPAGVGFFFGPGGEDGVLATIPLTIQASFQAPQTGGSADPVTYQAITFDGRPVEVSRQPQLKEVVGNEGEMLIPENWQWSPMGKGKLTLISAEAAEAPTEEGKEASILIRSSGGGSWAFSGEPVAKLAHAAREDLNIDQALFLLGGLGVHLGYGAEKLAEAISGAKPITVKVSHTLETQEGVLELAEKRALLTLDRAPDLKRNLWKEATEITDPTTVDTVLSLGFLNSENLITFVGYIPVIEASQQKLCELLLASRLGLGQCSVSALERAIRTTEEVLEGLKALAFRQG